MVDRLHGPRTTLRLAQASGRRRSPPVRGQRPQRVGQTLRARRRRLWRIRVVVALLVVALVAFLLRNGEGRPSGVAGVPSAVIDSAPDVDREVDVHAGYGTWVDVYDFVPRGSRPASVTPSTVTAMADQGVRTLYLQAAQFDARGRGLLVEPDLLAEFLVRAHQAGMRVVGWYLPRFVDVDRDLAHLAAISDFEVLGHRFDGVAVDIEWTDGVRDHAERSDRLVELSERLRETVGDDDALGAIVLPPVQIEVVNRSKWPDFPWRDLAGLYDVWLPMGYWTQRTPESGYNDGWTYTTENVRRLRRNLDDPDAIIHPIGGIGDAVTADHVPRFLRALDVNDAIGGSIYDWSTLDPAVSADIAAGIPTPAD